MSGPSRTEMNWIWTIGAPLVRAVTAMCFRVRIEGTEHVPLTGPVVLAPNHVSVLDGPVVSAMTGSLRRRATRNLIAAEIFHGLVGWILRQARQIPIRRGTGDTGALDEAVVALREGSCVGIFPEGRVSDDPSNGLQRLRSGLTRVAVPAGAPVVPVGLWGTATVWSRKGTRWGAVLRRPPLIVIYGQPVIPMPGESPKDFRGRFRPALQRVVDRARSLAGSPEEIQR
jgi:1-acyl-sn-glycerol-3-phosphate acyltransferase